MSDEGLNVTLRIVRKGPLVQRMPDGSWWVDGCPALPERAAALDAALGGAAEILDEEKDG